MEKFPSNTKHSPEKQAENFKNRLYNIFNTQLTVENIQNFSDDAMDKLINLIDEIQSTYQKETNEQLPGRVLEDKAFEHYKLHGINNLLDKIKAKSKQIAEIYQYIKSIPQIDEVIVPPDKLDLTKTTNGDIPWERKKILPRLAMLLYILETDLNIPKEEITIVEGIVSNEQMRTEPYYRVEINELNRLVYVCIEEGNVTYIFDQEKLKENNIEVELMDILTKQERNEALEQYPNLGTKLNQSSRWRENISELLTAEKLEYKTAPTIEKENNNTENIPRVSTSEFDEWRGFWTDPEGKHWGTCRQLIKKTNGIRIYKYIGNMTSKLITDLRGCKMDSYCYEDLIKIPEIKQNLKKKSEEKKLEIFTVDSNENPDNNQWYGFFTDENGQHWGSVRKIEERLNRSIAQHLANTPFKLIKDLGNHTIKGYCYENVIEISEVKKLTNSSSVATENNPEKNQWKDFWTDENGKHWGHIHNLTKLLRIQERTISQYIKTLPYKNISTANGPSWPAYCYEDFTEIPAIKKLINNPSVATENNREKNQWKNFWTDENGKHWGHIHNLAKSLGVSTPAIAKYVKTLPCKEIKGVNRIVRPAYCYEDFTEIPAIKKLINSSSVATENNPEKNQWKGFWTDENGKHWGHIHNLIKLLGVSGHKTITQHIELPYKEIKDVNGTSRPAYCYEDLIQIPEIKKLINNPSVATENNPEKNQWKGFWTDENGKHWGHIKNLAKLLGISTPTIAKPAYVKTLPYKEIRDINGIIRPSYCYEEVIQLPKIQELLRKKKLQDEKIEG